jgi:hypothetical protein
LKKLAKLDERIASLRQPGLDETGQGHARVCALLRAAAPTDFACDDQRPQHPLRLVVVGGHPRDDHKREEFALMAQEALGQRLTGVPFALGEHAIQLDPRVLEGGRRPLPRRRCPRHRPRLIIEVPQGIGPRNDGDLTAVLLLEGMQVPVLAT